MGLTDQPVFLNQVAEFETSLFPLRLLHRIHRIEKELGRVRTIVNGPRTVDIDIILYGSTIMKSAELEIPHPRYRERRFVLEPLAELNPGLRDPVTRAPISALLEAVRAQSVRRVNENS
jgi:2-amino-4-hydroxy-6-hydroxymethyldihydropteridine diphosphokinase